VECLIGVRGRRLHGERRLVLVPQPDWEPGWNPRSQTARLPNVGFSTY
jgi:hypothetical protein